MPKWLENTACQDHRRKESIGRCGIYGVNDSKKVYRCRDCRATFRQGKIRTYPVVEEKPPLPCTDFPLVDKFSKIMNEN